MTQLLNGILIRKTMNKTAVVNIITYKLLKKYNILIKYDKRYLVHNELNKGIIGMPVTIQSSIKKSKTKSWILI